MLLRFIPRRILILIVVALLGGQSYQNQFAKTPLGEDVSGIIAYVVDGDTVRLNGIKIRLWGVNAPEKDEHGYNQATSVLMENSMFSLVTCRVKSYDPYNRLVALCTRNSDNNDIGKEVIASGWAKDYRKYSNGFYRKTEEAAKKSKLGLWK